MKDTIAEVMITNQTPLSLFQEKKQLVHLTDGAIGNQIKQL